MADERALTVPNEHMALTFEDTMRLADVLVKSGYFRDMRDASQAVVKILMGREFGIGAMTAIRGIHIVEGKPELSAGLMAGLLRVEGYNWTIITLNDTGCTLDFRHGATVLGRVSFTAEDAKTAGLGGKDNYRKYGEDMYFARCISRGARRFAPEVLMGNAYVEGEIGMGNTAEPTLPTTTTAEGEIIDAQATPPPPALPKPAPQPAPKRTPKATKTEDTAKTPGPDDPELPYLEQNGKATRIRDWLIANELPAQLATNAVQLWQLDELDADAVKEAGRLLIDAFGREPQKAIDDVASRLAEALDAERRDDEEHNPPPHDLAETM